MMIHIGLYSVPGFDSVSSAKLRGIQNGSEWYEKRLSTLPTDYRPTSGWQETQAYHQKHYPDKKYVDFAQDLDVEKWDVESWVNAAVSISASYLVLTGKHHDGYCLWSTKTTSFCSVRRNVLTECRDAARRKGLKFGIYYSWMEFRKPMTKEYIDKIMMPQIQELIAIAPDIFWFDGDWMASTQYAQKVMDSAIAQIRRKFPHVSINDRIGHKEERQDPNFLGLSSYRVYHDRCIPTDRPDVPWEHVNTIGYSWGYNRMQKEIDYKPGATLMKIYQQVRSMGGRFLINIGPRSDGTICPEESKSLDEFRNLMRGSQKSRFDER
jgi:alpha-L-fucosidase